MSINTLSFQRVQSWLVQLFLLSLLFLSFIGNNIQAISVIDDNYEENDTLATAFDLSTYEGTWLNTINGYGIHSDDEWYKISMSGANQLLIDLQFIHAEGDIDLALFDASGTELDASESSTDNEFIDITVPSAGTYYIKLYYAYEGNSYNLLWHEASAVIPSTPVSASINNQELLILFTSLLALIGMGFSLREGTRR